MQQILCALFHFLSTMHSKKKDRLSVNIQRAQGGYESVWSIIKCSDIASCRFFIHLRLDLVKYLIEENPAPFFIFYSLSRLDLVKRFNFVNKWGLTTMFTKSSFGRTLLGCGFVTELCMVCKILWWIFPFYYTSSTLLWCNNIPLYLKNALQ